MNTAMPRRRWTGLTKRFSPIPDGEGAPKRATGHILDTSAGGSTGRT